MLDLICGDCLKEIRKLENDSIDLVLIDPPYGKIIKEDWDKNNKPFSLELIAEFYRILRNSGNIYVWCGIGEQSKSLLDFIPILDSKFYFKDLITWKKQRGIGMRRGWLYTREEILWYVKDNKKFFWNKANQYDTTDKRLFTLPNNKSDYKRWTNVWYDIKEVAGSMKSSTFHPCEKPVEALERIIKCSTKQNDMVLDCFMGSGSTGVACVNTNRNFIGIELDQNYYNVAKNRLNSKKG